MLVGAEKHVLVVVAVSVVGGHEGLFWVAVLRCCGDAVRSKKQVYISAIFALLQRGRIKKAKLLKVGQK